MHQIEYFVQVARYENLSQAARVLCVSQPTLSKAIRKLEAELGADLFDRQGKRLRLNERGRRLQDCAERLLRELRQTTDAIRGSTSAGRGRLRVGVFGQQADALACLTAFLRTRPLIDLTLDARRRSSSDQLLDEYDMVFYPDTDTFANLVGVPYGRSRLGIGVCRDHPLAQASVVDLRLFRDEPFVFMNTNAGSYEQAHLLCLASGFEPQVRIVTSSGMAQAAFVAAGLGVGFVTDDARAFGDSGVVRLELEQATSEQILRFACRPRRQLSPLARELLEFACGHFGIPEERLDVLDPS